MNRKLTERKKTEIKKLISLKQFRAAVKNMKNNKTSGLDRLKIELYKSVLILVNIL